MNHAATDPGTAGPATRIAMWSGPRTARYADLTATTGTPVT